MPKSFVFPVSPVDRFAGKSSNIRRPKEIACFSYDSDHTFRLDTSSLRYFYTPDINADLNKGYEKFIKQDDTGDEHLDGLLAALTDLEKRTGKSCCEGYIVTWRGMMTKLMTIPYMGNPFIEENHDFKLASKAREPQDDKFKIMSYWGYKFETLSTLPVPWGECSREYIEARPNEVVNNKAQYCSIVKTGFGDTNLILAGEVDAVWDTKPANSSHPINYVELKTTKKIRNSNDELIFRRKLQRFWAQSFLLGVPKLIIGYRDQKGFLRDIETMETQGIPNFVKKGMHGEIWDGNTVMNFATSLLAWIKESLAGQTGVWRLRFVEKGEEVNLYQMEESGLGGILSEDFLKWREELHRNLKQDDAEVSET